MAEVVLHYFDLHGKAETVRLILSYYGVQFTDHVLSEEDWTILKDQGFSEFKQLPRLDIDGLQLIDTYSIVRFLSQKYGAYPSDPYQVYLVESICSLRDEIYEAVLPFFSRNDLDSVENWFRSNARALKIIEKRLITNAQQNRYFAGQGVTMADFVMFEMGYDYFCRPGRRDRLEVLLRESAPNYYHFVRMFTESSLTLRNYLQTRKERPY